MNKNALVNYRTGEVIDLSKATPVEITEALSMLIIKRKELQAIEDKVKKHIKQSELYFDDNVAEYGIAKVRKGYRQSFDKKKFESKATQQERDIMELADEVQKKYTKLTEIITIF